MARTEDNQQKFYDACLRVREAWGLNTSTFDEIVRLIGQVIWTSTQPGVDEARAQVQVEAIWFEWTQYRAFSFMRATSSSNKVSATISRFPGGKHYHVTLLGSDVNIAEKFNTQPEAQKFYNSQLKRLKKEGREIIESGAV
jgi:hypothetical protein